MSTSIIFVAILVVGFLAARLFGRIAPRRAGLTGLGFLALGVVLGPILPARVLSRDVLGELDLFVSILLGFIGFVTGLRLRAALRNFEASMAGALSALVVIITVAAACAALVQPLHPDFAAAEDFVVAIPLLTDGNLIVSLWLGTDAFWVTLGLAAAAGVASRSLIARVALEHPGTRTRARALEELATVGTATSIVVLGFAMAGRRVSAAGPELQLSSTEWAGIVVGFGAIAGVLFTVYLGRERDAMRMTVAAIGAVTFAAGVGVALRVSPLFVGLVAGTAVAATSSQSDPLERALQPLVNPASLIIMLFAGAYWRPVSGWLWLLPIVYAGVRMVVRLVATRAAAATFVEDMNIGSDLGRAMLGHGVLAAAIALGFAQRFGDHADVVLTTVLGGMVLTDLWAARSVRRVFADNVSVKRGA